MESKFDAFLKTCVSKSSDNIITTKPTHLKVSQTLGGKYTVDDAKYYRLIKYYIEKFVSEPNFICHINERHKDACFIIVDVDFEYPQGIKERRYTEPHIRAIADLYVEQIQLFLDISEMKYIRCYVQEKEKPELKRKAKPALPASSALCSTLPSE